MLLLGLMVSLVVVPATQSQDHNGSSLTLTRSQNLRSSQTLTQSEDHSRSSQTPTQSTHPRHLRSPLPTPFGSRPDLGPRANQSYPNLVKKINPSYTEQPPPTNQQYPTLPPARSQTYVHSNYSTDQSLASITPSPPAVPESDSRSITNQSHIDQPPKTDQPYSREPPGGAQTYHRSSVPANLPTSSSPSPAYTPTAPKVPPANPPIASSASPAYTPTAPEVPPAGSPYYNQQQKHRQDRSDVELSSSSKSSARVDVKAKTIVQVFSGENQKEACTGWCLSEAGEFVCCNSNLK